MRMMLLVALLAAVPALGQAPAYLVKDLNPAPIDADASGSFPRDFVLLDGRAYFTASDAAHGRELWQSDGTPAGTRLLTDLNPGDESSSPRDLTVVGDALWFRAWEGRRGCGLWRSDGSSAGTRLVAIVHANALACTRDARDGGHPTEFAGLGAAVLFVADSEAAGRELWRSDGSAAGTALLADINLGGSGNPRGLLAFDGAVYFAADDGVHGAELWRSDGTALGTRLVRDIEPGPVGGLYPEFFGNPYFNPVRFYVVGGGLVFAAFDSLHGVELWRSDGSAGGTDLLLDSEPGSLVRGLSFRGGFVSPFVALDATTVAFFSMTVEASDVRVRIWRSDGTEAGTTVLGTILYASADIGVPPFNATRVGSGVLFTIGEQNGTAIWRVDGVGEPTEVTIPTRPVGAVAVLGNLVLFHAPDGEGRCGLWRSDGSAAGTFLVRGDAPRRGECSDGIEFDRPGFSSAVVGARVLLAAEDGARGSELFASDGSAPGTELVADINNSTGRTGGARFSLHAAVDDRLFFSTSRGDLDDATAGAPRGLWRTDGTAGGTIFLGPVRADRGGVVGDRFIFVGSDVQGQGLWASDGSPGGTTPLVRDLSFRGTAVTTPAGVFQLAADAAGVELWRSDGTVVGTKPVTDLSSGPADPNFAQPVAFDGGVAFAVGTATGTELWHSHGTAAGTRRFASFPAAGLDQLLDVDGRLYASLIREGRHGEIWRSDGSAAGTVLIADLDMLAAPAGIAWLARGPGALFFAAADEPTGLELWRSDGSAGGTGRVSDIASGPASALQGRDGSVIQRTGVAGGALLFVADDGVRGPELWRSDGTETGTTLLRDIDPRRPEVLIDGLSLSLTQIGDRVVFAPVDGEAGVEPWVSDGTASGTRRLADIAPGLRSGLRAGAQFGATTTHVFFAADDGMSGQELWAMPRAALSAGRCGGDCNGDGRVAIDELVRGVALALGSGATDVCAGLDGDGDGLVSIAELIGAVVDALAGC